MPDEIESKFYSLFDNINVCLEMAIVIPDSSGFIVYSVLPDFVEILFKLYLKDRGNNSSGSFYDLKDEVRKYIDGSNHDDYDECADFFVDRRNEIRNPLHHEATIHRFQINQYEQLESIRMFFHLTNILFKQYHDNLLSPQKSECNRKYAAYHQFLNYKARSILDERNYRFQRLEEVLSEEVRREQEDRYGSGIMDHSRMRNILLLEKIREKLPLNNGAFCRQILNYEYDLREKVVETLRAGDSSLSIHQIQTRLRENRGERYKQDTIKNCLNDLDKTDDMVERIYEDAPNTFRLVD